MTILFCCLGMGELLTHVADLTLATLIPPLPSVAGAPTPPRLGWAC